MLLDILLAKLWGFDCWIWLLLAGIIPFILGWLFGSSFKREKTVKNIEDHPDYGDLHAKLTTFEKDEQELKYKLEQTQGELDDCNSRNQSISLERLMYKAKLEELGELPGKEGGGDAEASVKLAAGAPVDWKDVDWKHADRGNYGAFFSNDNLQVVEGIGPKVESILKGVGIANWAALAGKSSDDLKATLAENKLQMMNPDSWPRQAQLAEEGKWDELSEYQRFLDGGRADVGDFETPAKIDKLAAAGGIVSASTAVAKSADTGISYGSVFEADNLQIIEGIGPKVEKLLKGNGINTWSDLAGASVDDLKALLADNKLQMMKPDSWPQQAGLAAAGKWTELIELQKFLDGGRENTGDFENDSKAEKMALKILGFSTNPEDLKIVEGIGPKIEGLLKDAGINTWADLAATSVDKIQGVLDAAGDRYKLAKPATWPKQAGLAAAGKWGELKEYQDYLDGGSDPTA